MKRGFIPAILFTLSFLTPLSGQVTDLVISGNFRDTPFVEFVEELESRTEVRFYYRESWVRGIRVTLSGDQLFLREAMEKSLGYTGLSYYIDRDLRVFITNQSPVISRLPDYSGSEAGSGDLLEGSLSNALTSVERKYIEGRRAGMLETLTVGNRQEGSGTASVVIHGKLTDAETGESLIGATIYFVELKKGAATDVDGRFSIVVTTGKHTEEFNCMGMEDRNNNLLVYSGGDLSVTMEKALIPITEVVIKANRYHNVRGTQMGFDRLNYKVLKEIPVVMGEKDILKVVQMLPGVQSVGEGATGFNVRGSAADQNMIYIQKVPVYNSSHLFGFFTSFSPDIVKDFTLFKSNLPASFGGRLASFFDISTRQGNMNNYTARGGISPVTAHLAVEGPIRKENSAFILTGRSTYSDWVLNRIQDPVIRNSDAGFYDVATALSWEPGEKTLV
jgi:hypothetical protein